MIQNMVGESEVGIYSVAYSIGMLVQLFTNAINNSLTPWMYENLNRKDYKNIRRNVNAILLFLGGVIVGLCFFVPELVKIFGSEEYYSAIYVVPPVAASVYFIFLYNVFAIPQMYYEKQKFMSVASIAAAILNGQKLVQGMQVHKQLMLQIMPQRIAAHHLLCLFVQLAIDKDQRLIKIE